MQITLSDEITPWQENIHDNIFTIPYEDRKSVVLKKKFSGTADNRSIELKSKRKNSLRRKLLIEQRNELASLRALIPQTSLVKSQEDVIFFRAEKLIPKYKQQKEQVAKNHKSTIISTPKPKVLTLEGSDFVIKRHQRFKKLSRILFSEIKMEEIFKKVCEIQNPTNRQNISLPKIQIKM